MPSVLELIDAWRSKQVSGTTLMRGLVSYREWLLLFSEAAVSETLASDSPPRLQYTVSPDGKKRLPIFSNEEALKAYTHDSHVGQHFLKTEGTWLFKLPFQELDEIWIDPAQQEAVFYGKNILKGCANSRPLSRLREISPNCGRARAATEHAFACGATPTTGS